MFLFKIITLFVFIKRNLALIFLGQWETNNHSDRPGHWKEGDNWDGWSTNRSLEFENIMTWDDSGAVEAYHVANERHKAFSRGLRYPTPLPSPDLYIQTIDWDTHESFELPDSGETTLETEERSGQRKRGRRGFKGDKRGNKQFSKKDDEYSDWKQTDRLASESGQPQAVSGWGRDIYRGSSKAEISRKEMYHTTPIAERQERHDGERYYGASDPAFMERPTYWGHTDRLKTPQESQLQHPISYDYSPQNHYNFRWQQQNISGDVPRGWSSPLVKGVRESHQGVNPHYCYQVGQTSTGGGLHAEFILGCIEYNIPVCFFIINWMLMLCKDRLMLYFGSCSAIFQMA